MNTTSWPGPPTDILGYPVPLQQFVAKTDHTVVALQHVIAFLQGCTLNLDLAVRRGSLDESAWKSLIASHFEGDPEPPRTEGDLKFGVRFPDGSRATTVDHSFRGWAHPTDRPEPPMLIKAGCGSFNDDQFSYSDLRLWRWPLPPPRPFEFVIEWQNMGLNMTHTTLDGSAIVRAAAQAMPYWA